MGQRIATLDLIRGVAVMGILVANLPAFGLPGNAYYSPLPWGGSGPADIVAWTLTYVLIEGKMRGLFSFLFGASMLLVVERARAVGEDAGFVHYSRMFWLFGIGLAHLYLLWWGDILTHYALVGAIAYPFTRLSTRWLVAGGLLLIGVQCAIGAALGFADGPPEMLQAFGAPAPAAVAAEIAAMRGSWPVTVAWRVEHAFSPLTFLPVGGAETLGYLLLGMAGLRSGYLSGAWEWRRYRTVVAVTLPIAAALYGTLAARTIASGFDPRVVLEDSLALATPIRPVMVLGYAGLAILLARPGGWLTERIAAAGRAAFTNYLGTTILMCLVFQGWGLGLFGRLGRAEMYAIVPLAWALMLAWSKPWLDRYRYGPFEWLWRSLSRLELQPMRRSS